MREQTRHSAPAHPSSPQLPLESRRRSPLVLLGLLALAGALALSFVVFKRSVVYYRTPTEALAYAGEPMRLSGQVVPGSVQWRTTEGLVTFEVTDGRSTVKVEHAGAAPDTLIDDAEAVAEGTLGEDHVFRSDKLFARCPSKFETADRTEP